ncbi:NUDIX domain-containing protein [Candidatus Saccharibacteria bacterium]|nr:NUDIX domain-containing protein [Candidatus Saccharibacteria bacterium]
MKEILPTAEETARFVAEGLTIDTQGRPIHPDLLRVIGAHGIRTGKGAYWYWGPNKTADPIIIARERNEDRVLTIIRKDNGRRALTGGFLDLHNGRWESPLAACIREANEEADVDISNDPFFKIYDGPVVDDRETVHAWPYTHAVLFVHPEFSDTVAGDDAVIDSSEWVPVSELDLDALHGSHGQLITAALGRYYELRNEQ